MLAVGQSSIPGMTPLPGVREEIAFIQKILGGDSEALTPDECKAIVVLFLVRILFNIMQFAK